MNRLRWLPQHVALLGRMSDSRVAEVVGCHPHTARAERIARSIPAWERPKPQPGAPRRVGVLPWPSPEADALLGTMADATLGELVARGHSAVADRRRALGIPSHGHRYSRAILAELRAVAPRSLDTIEIAARVGCTRDTARAALERMEDRGEVVLTAVGLPMMFSGGNANVWRIA